MFFQFSFASATNWRTRTKSGLNDLHKSYITYNLFPILLYCDHISECVSLRSSNVFKWTYTFICSYSPDHFSSISYDLHVDNCTAVRIRSQVNFRKHRLQQTYKVLQGLIWDCITYCRVGLYKVL